MQILSKEQKSISTSMVLQRNYRILLSKFVRYLLPTTLTMVALSFNGIFSSMIVANLLGSEAVGIVALGFPIIFLASAVNSLFGIGGASLYAVLLGEHQGEKAGKVLCLSLAAAFICGLFMMTAGLVFPEFFISLLCSEESLAASFSEYFRVLMLSAPLFALVLTLLEFLPPSGSPILATIVISTANGLNLLMNYIYIAYFDMGVEGAAWGALTGYSASILVLVVAFWCGKTRLHVQMAYLRDLPLLWKCISTGSASAASQLSFAIKYAFCNHLAALYGGTAGIVAFSICLQAFSLVSAFYSGIINAATPLLGVLHGEGDFSGRSHVLKTAFLYETVIVIAFVLWFEFAPEQTAAIYNITDSQESALTQAGLRIFVLAIILRAVCITFMFYLQILQEHRYAMAISMFDGFVGIVPLAWLLCSFMGLDGLWWTYPINSVLLFVGVLLYNLHLSRKSGRYKNIFLSQRDEATEKVWDFTMTNDPKDISLVSEQLIELGKRSGLESKSALILGLAVEEMAVYTRNHMHTKKYIDILARLYKDRIEINFRSLGESFNPLTENEGDDMINLKLIRSLAGSLKYDYVMGMNNARITLARA